MKIEHRRNPDQARNSEAVAPNARSRDIDRSNQSRSVAINQSQQFILIQVAEFRLLTRRIEMVFFKG
jgi:hypothetical protein